MNEQQKENVSDALRGCAGCIRTATLIGSMSVFTGAMVFSSSLRHSVFNLFKEMATVATFQPQERINQPEKIHVMQSKAMTP